MSRSMRDQIRALYLKSTPWAEIRKATGASWRACWEAIEDLPDMAPGRWDAALKDRVRALYDQGRRAVWIHRKIPWVPLDTLRHWIADAATHMSPRERYERGMALVRQGVADVVICSRLNVCPDTVRRWRRRYTPPQPKGQRPPGSHRVYTPEERARALKDPEYAASLGISASTIRKYQHHGLPAVRMSPGLERLIVAVEQKGLRPYAAMKEAKVSRCYYYSVAKERGWDVAKPTGPRGIAHPRYGDAERLIKEGVKIEAIATETGVSAMTVYGWRRRLVKHGLL